MNKPRVAIRPWVYQSITGYRVRWTERGKVRSYFALDIWAARHIKRRAKEGKRPTKKYWAVKV